MKELNFLRSKEVKQLMKRVFEQWGADFMDLFQEYAFLKNKDKVYIVSRAIAEVPFEKLRINNVGLYILEDRHDELRLSVEGSQLLGPKAAKNVVELSKEELVKWIKGNDLVKEGKNKGFVIIKHNKDFFGSGKFKDGRLLNFLPKIRRLSEVNV